MLYKFALCDAVTIPSNLDNKIGMVRTASGRIIVEPNSEKAKIVEAEISKHPTALFFRAKAIKADEMNSNGDYFSEKELLKGYKSFEGVPFFTNHENQNIENAKGKIIFAEWVPEERSVYTIAFVDREAFPNICRSIEEEYVTGVSMGAISGESLIVMADLSEKRISDINEGEEILSAYGNKRKVKRVHNEYLGKPMYSFDLATYHKTPMFTDDHPIFMVEKSLIEANKQEAIRACSNSRYEQRMGRIEESIGQDAWRTKDYNADAKFTQANKIQKDDFILIPSKFKTEDGSSLNSDFYYIVGAYLGDGYLKKDKKGEYEAISFCLGLNEIELAQKITTILKKYSKSEPCDLVCEDRNGLYISLYDRKLAKWFAENIGTGSKTKRLKFDLKFKEDALNLLAGYLDTDGCISKKTNTNHTNSYQFSSANIGLLEDIQSLLISLDCISRISSFNRTPSKNSVVKINTIEHTLAVGSNNSNLFKNSIKFNLNGCHTAKIKAGKTFIVNVNGNKFMACPVKDIYVEEFSEPVYDITVEEDECYIADGVAVHNCSVEYSVCNICSNKAEKTDDYCTHIRNRKGRKFSGKAKDVVTGELKEFKNVDVYEYNYGLKFIELSAVVDPACASCHIEGIIPNDDYLKRVANMQNQMYMVRTAAIEKHAGQEELTQLEQVLSTLEGIAVGLVQNRQQVEVEFASDLVGILADLQKFTDELVGAGYGNVQSIPGTMDAPEGGMLPETEPLPDAGLGGEILPVAEESPLGDVGSVSGAPGQPPVNSPQLPITAPIKPMAFDTGKLVRMASLATNLLGKIQSVGDSDMVKRRTKSAKREDKLTAIKILSNSWQEKQEFFEYIKQMPSLQDNNYKLSVKKRDDSFIIVAEDKDPALTGQSEMVWTYEDLNEEERSIIKESPKEASIKLLETFASSLNNKKEGVDQMADNIRVEAGASSINKQPEVITEVQLENEKGLYHPRTNEQRDSITEKQLADDNGRNNNEQDVITEAQLAAKSNKLNPRVEQEVDVITEAQLKASREGDAPEVITEKQLDAQRTEVEADVITEKQLDNASTPWERAAKRNSSMFKSAGEHMQAVVGVMADSVIATGSTIDEITSVAKQLISSTTSRYNLVGNIMTASKSNKGVDYAKRLAFWSNRNVKVSGITADEASQLLISGLRKVASDETINPEVVVDAIEVITEGMSGTDAISKAIDAKMAVEAEKVAPVNVKDELRASLAPVKDTAKEERAEERAEILASVEKKEKTADTMIETSFSEVGIAKSAKRDQGFRSTISSFAKGALASKNIKLAAITNVTINGDTIQIAVQTDAGSESVEIPIGESVSPLEEEVVPEVDLDGEGLEEAFASRKSMKRVAQSPMGGGIPGAPGGNAGGPGAPESGLPGGAPAADPIQALTTDGDLDGMVDEIPTAGKQQMPYAICPECGSSDVDIKKEGGGDIKGFCNACSAEYEALIKKSIEFRITKPTKSVGEDGVSVPEGPEVPALPVAAQTRVDKNSLVRIATNQEKHGHVCPACGMSNCKVASSADGHQEYSCPACGTDVKKDLLVNVENPDESYLRVQWDLVPQIDESCEGCKEAAEVFASVLKVEGLMKQASSTEFPKANCMERIARTYGGNAVASFGPCKGKPLADCVCNQLERLGLTKVRHLDKLASTYSQEDPMDECMKEQNGKGFDVKEAEAICGCLKKKFASKVDDNPFMQAFASDIESGREKVLTAQDLGVINDMFTEEEAPVEDTFEDIDIGDDLVDEDLGDDLGETVTIEVSKEAAEEIADAVLEATEVTVDVEEVGSEIPEVPQVPEIGSAAGLEVADEALNLEEKEMALAMQTHKLRRVGEDVVKIAGTPKVVKDIEGNVEAGVPRAKATMGNEGADNIDVPMAKPSIPRGNAEMGNESASNINPKAGLPNVPVDSSYMGAEKAAQEGMPAINNEIKGTVIAKKLKEVDTVEGDVEAGVPRAKATIGNEGADNIDVPMAKPSIPRGNAEMGNEGADNINPKADGPDVPVDSAYMGDEKAVQKDMPGINSEMLKNVQQSRDVQMDRIASARRTKAIETAAKLLATNRISEQAYEDVIEALSHVQIDRIASVADNMYPKKAVKTASAQDKTEVTASHSIPAIVMESKNSSSDVSLTDKISSAFTIGNKSFDEDLTRYGVK